jgi:hypothetical protein
MVNHLSKYLSSSKGAFSQIASEAFGAFKSFQMLVSYCFYRRG